jgi:hypothetical protein
MILCLCLVKTIVETPKDLYAKLSIEFRFQSDPVVVKKLSNVISFLFNRR